MMQKLGFTVIDDNYAVSVYLLYFGKKPFPPNKVSCSIDISVVIVLYLILHFFSAY